jgi:photosystem II stability/assembly factor-like uncharacterized protein/outer membrane protein assembly factor BamB
MVARSGTENPQDYGLSEEQAQSIAARYGFSPSQFRQQDEEVQKRVLLRIRYVDLPRLRAEFAALFHRGDDGEIPPDGHARAAERLNEMRAEAATGERGRVAGMSVGQLLPEPLMVEHSVDVALPNNTGWTSLGPGNIGGRIRSIVINPFNARNIYIGSAGGGVWSSNDGGQSWQPADDLMASLAVCAMAMVPINPLTIYAGTGEGYNSNAAIRGDGIFKTTDGGRTWKQLAGTKANPDFQWVTGIAVNRDGSVILAATQTGIFRSIDEGETWSKQLSANVGNILINPWDNTKCIAGMLDGGGIYFSTNSGSNWTQSTYSTGGPTLRRIQVCYAAKKPIIAPEDHTIVYASVQVILGTMPPTYGSQIWRSDNGGQSFTRLADPPNYLGSQGTYANIIWAGDPTNSDLVIVGGVDLYRRDKAGSAFNRISDGLMSGSIHVDHHMILADPGYDASINRTVYFCTDGGLYKTTDVTVVGTPTYDKGWVSLNSNLAITQFYSVSGTSTTSGGTTFLNIVGGTQDNGTLRYAGQPNGWIKWATGDGGYVASDWTRNFTYYGEALYLEVFRSTSAGYAAEDICGYYYDQQRGVWAWKLGSLTIPDAKPDAQNVSRALPIAPLMLDPGNANRLIAGGASIWLTINPQETNSPQTGPAWTELKPPVLVPVPGQPDATALVSAMAMVSGSTQMLAGYDRGQVWKLLNNTWQRIDSGIGANRICTSLTFDKTNINRLFATFGGFNANNLWRSLDGGSTWASVGTALPPAPIYCVTIHPNNAQWVYVGTENGVFASEDGGLSWAPNNQGPTNCRVYQLTWLGSTLCCATHGRGIFAIDLAIRQVSQVVVGDAAGNLRSFNAQTGAQVSAGQLGNPVTAPPLVDGKSVYCAFSAIPPAPFANLAKFNDAGSLGPPATAAWVRGVYGAINATPCLVRGTSAGDSDLLYVFAANGQLSAFSAAGSTMLWALQVVPEGIVGTGITACSIQVMNQWLYIATDKGLYAFDIQTQMVRWAKTSYVCTAAALLVSNTLFVPTLSGTIYSVQARTGVENWNYPAGAAIKSTPVWILGSVIFGTENTQVIALDYSSGGVQCRWQGIGTQQIQAIAADGNKIYFVGNAQSGNLYAYQLTISGATRRFDPLSPGIIPLVSAPGSASPPQITGTSVYLTTTNNKLQAYNTATGTLLWQQSLAATATGGPALAYA